ncbi:MAG: zinc-dependent alcohol dehydrogenase family protein [Rhodospirillaceae bacterium]|jgi:NADPH:quinone reductase|nr:zinc-dependent alcohol dehydrogenase family protein [Rhodospirillaceae bacterium]MBT4045579.1 zinc-dependent alcohol dehydrogenase family protein [Rhodospirillaceae bacterium]MBT4687153.1 zinc-dependent alcohol dehydrogenase family protein [Rhodospirillaceae bacterium]MBT5081343.1 zinc-dependent alcohol dehydrogenase family protein [Rhodospirillaceae bacterium]MBT5522827.1 zinc-dependent alcohol dehydrogenase family protein [Rhodospirillaceae bacterium]
MKAMIIRKSGAPEVFELADIPVPEIGPQQVLVRVAATSVNPVDWKIRKLGPPIGPEMPAVLQGDVSGLVEAVGREVSDFKIGDEVYGCAGGVKGTGGALAEFMACDGEYLAPKPSNLSMEEAAALPLVCLTAWEGLVDGANVGWGQTVLVHAGVGGVGHVAIQIAIARGATVYATVSGPEKAELVRGMGAIPINYRDNSVADYVAEHTGGVGFDIVYDTVGGDNIPKSWEAAKLRGTVISCQTNSTQDLTPLHLKGLQHIGVLMLIPLLHGRGGERHGEIMREITALAEAGQIRPLMDGAPYALEDVAKAHARMESGQAMGKVVVRVSA